MSRVISLIIVIAICGAAYGFRDQLIALFQTPPPPPPPQIIEKVSISQTTPQKHKMHKWVDEKGQVHYSDAAPKTPSQASNEISVNELQTTQFEKTAPVYIPNTTSRRASNDSNRNTTSSRSSRCKRLKQSIKQSEQSMRDHNSYSRSFESKKKRLQEKRWEMQKSC